MSFDNKIRISNIAQLPSALASIHADHFDPITGNVKPEFWSTPGAGDAAGNYYFVQQYELCSPSDAPYTPPSPPHGGDPALMSALAQRDAAELALQAALATYLAIVSPVPSDREPVNAAENRLNNCKELVALLTPLTTT